jgi:hypothetical protein
MISIKRSLSQRVLAGAATATVALGLLGAAPATLAADRGHDSWWYNNSHDEWHGNNDWHDSNDSWRYRGNLSTYASYRYSGGRPYYYAPPPVYYHTPLPAYADPPAHVGPPTLNLGFTS